MVAIVKNVIIKIKNRSLYDEKNPEDFLFLGDSGSLSVEGKSKRDADEENDFSRSSSR